MLFVVNCLFVLLFVWLFCLFVVCLFFVVCFCCAFGWLDVCLFVCCLFVVCLLFVCLLCVCLLFDRRTTAGVIDVVLLQFVCEAKWLRSGRKTTHT